MQNKEFWNEEVNKVFEILETNESGLTTTRAEELLSKNGENKLQEAKKESVLMKFLEQFKDFTVIILIVAAIVSGIVDTMNGHDLLNTIVILLVVLANAIIGVIQEVNAEKSLEALKKLTEYTAIVIRDGKEVKIPSRNIVVGDILVLEAGDYISADARLIEVTNLSVNESQLTGESLPVNKQNIIIDKEAVLGDRVNMVFTSSLVTNGRAKAVVTSTAMDTEVGKIAGLLNETENKETPLKQKLNKLGKNLGTLAIGICVIIFVVGLMFGKSALSMFITAISLAVAAIPEGLPAIATIVQALGVKKLVNKNAIVKKLPAVETLGSATVICSDKTGTLTENKMTVKETYLVNDNNLNNLELIKAMVLCNNAKVDFNENQEIGDPTEVALIKYAKENNEKEFNNLLNISRVYEIPFDSDKKYMVTINKIDEKYVLYIKGGLDEVLANCNITKEEETKVQEQNKNMAIKALRVLGYGYLDITNNKEIINNLDTITEEEVIKLVKGQIEFIGISGMIDPPRKEAKDAISKCKLAGIKTVMITGDHKLTATAIAKELGILENEDEVMEGKDLENMTDEELQKVVSKISVYTRVSPKHKVRIVEAFQALGEVVAMTGDGVNDAPALKRADIGCAMGITGTDVSKEAADVIITDDNFATIVTSVEEGRRIYDNIIKSIQYLLSSNIGELVVILIAILTTPIVSKYFGITDNNLDKLIPLIAIQILWINLVTDSLPALALAEDKADKDIMKRKPNKDKSIFDKTKIYQITYQGIMMGIIMFVAYIIGLSIPGDNDYKIRVAQTMAFMAVGFGELVHVFNVRHNQKTVFRKETFTNKYLIGAVIINAILMLGTVLIPFARNIFKLELLPLNFVGYLVLLVFSPLVIVELMKLLKINGK